MIDFREIPAFKDEDEGPFTDDMVRHMVNVAKTQRGIIDYAEGMAQVLAEAGRASNKATGDSPQTAVNKWIEVIRARAFQLLKEPKDELATSRLLVDDK